MKTTNRPNTATRAIAKTERANDSDCDESELHFVIELDECEMAQIGGGSVSFVFGSH
jgi:hypothetical protein